MTIKMTNTSLVSVIMNCFNSEQFLKQSIQSIISQTYFNWELIFWDNGSTDNSRKIVSDFRDERIKYFYNEETVPLGHARNLALNKISGEFVAFLDCDDLWVGTKLEKQIQYFNKSSNTDFIYSNFYSMHGDNKRLAYPVNEILPSGHIMGDLLIRYRINLQSVIFRKDLLDHIDEWFDTSLELCEEMELFLRISMNAMFSYINEPLVSYRVHGNQLTVTKFDKLYEERAYIIKKLCGKFPLIEDEYQNEITSYMTTMALDKSSDLILQHQKIKAHKILKRYRFKKMKFFVIWLLSFLPLPLYLKVNKALGRNYIYERFEYLQKHGNICLQK